MPWWRSPSRKCHQAPSAHASLLSPLLLAASPRPFPSCSLQVKRLCSRHSSLPPWSASLLPIQPSCLSLAFFSLSPFLCLSLLPQLSSVHLAYLDPIFSSPHPPPTHIKFSFLVIFHRISPPCPIMHNILPSAYPVGELGPYFHEGDDPTWAPLTL